MIADPETCFRDRMAAADVQGCVAGCDNNAAMHSAVSFA